jgi:hypothetical protein
MSERKRARLSLPDFETDPSTTASTWLVPGTSQCRSTTVAQPFRRYTRLGGIEPSLWTEAGQVCSGRATGAGVAITARAQILTFFRLLYSPAETSETTGALNATFNGTLKVQARLSISADGQSFGEATSLQTLTHRQSSFPRLEASARLEWLLSHCPDSKKRKPEADIRSRVMWRRKIWLGCLVLAAAATPPQSAARVKGASNFLRLPSGQNHLSQTSALPGPRPKTSGLLRKPCAIESSNSFLALHRGFAEYSSIANPFLFPSLMLRGCAPAKLGRSTGAICKWNRCGIS